MFNKDFYPTPASLAYDLLFKYCKHDVQSVLEPSAGKGDFAQEVANRMNSNRMGYPKKADVSDFDIDCIEIEPELQSILRGKGFRVIANDFLTFHTYKRYDLIVMNPPFSDGAKHLLKALEMQQYGGAVLCILNAETIRNPYTNERKALVHKLESLGATIEYKKNAFSAAERRTDVEIAVIYVNIPRKSFSCSIFDNLKRAEELEQNQEPAECSQIAHADRVKAIVQQFNAEARAGITLIAEYEKMQSYILREFDENGEPAGSPIIDLRIGNKQETGNSRINHFMRCLRMKYWSQFFKNPAFVGKLTTNLQRQFSEGVDNLKDFDFSLFNVYTVQQQMAASMVRGLEDTILSLFDEFSHKYYWDKSMGNNIHYFNGWASNSAWKINKKIVIPMQGWHDPDNKWGSCRFDPDYQVMRKLQDIEKVFEYLDGGRTDAIDLETRIKLASSFGQSRDIELKFFTISFYKKGTAHITFKDDALLKKFNIFGAQRKSWLPPSYGNTQYQDMGAAEKRTVEEFEGKEAYSETMKDREFYIMDNAKMLLLTQ